MLGRYQRSRRPGRGEAEREIAAGDHGMYAAIYGHAGTGSLIVAVTDITIRVAPSMWGQDTEMDLRPHKVSAPSSSQPAH